MRIESTDQFDAWFSSLRDGRARNRIAAAIDRWAYVGRPVGDVKALSAGLYEARFDTGPGYRVYYTLRAGVLVLLLVGGDKSSQARDVRRARRLADEWKEN